MSYQVLARKWRPKNFNEMVGQAHVLRALINALESGRLHHAYLFTGTRGVGKTTIARILAKSLNCHEGVSSTPCSTCDACVSIDEGRFVDLIEIDAASRTKVEDTREILDNVQYAPTQGRYKVYLIDEVHMLSNHSFNALLKTLEEPPPHVKFILATTDPQKLPATILSRCLQFSLSRMPADMIFQHLGDILQKEAVAYESHALKLLAQAADGSMRDALSLLDQSLAYGQGDVTSEDVTTMLGYIDRDYIFKILHALHAHDAQALLDQVALLSERVADFVVVLDALIATLHHVSITQVLPAAVDDMTIDSTNLQELARTITPEDVQLYYQIALHGKRDLPYASDSRSGFEMTLLRMLAFKPVEDATTPAAASAHVSTTQAATTVKPAKAQAINVSTQTTTLAPSQDVESVPAISNPVADESVVPRYDFAIENWPAIIKAIKISGLTAQLASNAAIQQISSEADTHTVVLSLAREHSILERQVSKLELALRKYYGLVITVKAQVVEHVIETPAAIAAKARQEQLSHAKASIQNDPMVKSLQENFDAKIIEESIQPIEH